MRQAVENPHKTCHHALCCQGREFAQGQPIITYYMSALYSFADSAESDATAVNHSRLDDILDKSSHTLAILIYSFLSQLLIFSAMANYLFSHSPSSFDWR